MGRRKGHGSFSQLVTRGYSGTEIRKTGIFPGSTRRSRSIFRVINSTTAEDRLFAGWLGESRGVWERSLERRRHRFLINGSLKDAHDQRSARSLALISPCQMSS
ncbi:hypothetical protein RUM43_001886 [Polyplax serrata]|uniref:Uncharacterized protein n=1 Tax=Polyplax serrata TaxID=468196 RepID=A0AAN8SGV9_POLSC